MKQLNKYINEQLRTKFKFSDVNNRFVIANQIKDVGLSNSNGINSSLSNLVLRVNKSDVANLRKQFPVLSLEIGALAEESIDQGIEGYQQQSLLVKILIAGCKKFEKISDKLNDTGIFACKFKKPIFNKQYNSWSIPTDDGYTLYIYLV